MIGRMIHRIAHKLSWNQGYPETFTFNKTKWIGFVCGTCHEIQGLEQVVEYATMQTGKYTWVPIFTGNRYD